MLRQAVLACHLFFLQKQLKSLLVRIERRSFFWQALVLISGLLTISLLPAVHVRCKSLEVLTEYLADSQSDTAELIVTLATRIWRTATATEVLELAAEVLPAGEFTDLCRWVQCHYPLIFVAFHSRATSQDFYA